METPNRFRKIKCNGCNSWREDVYYTFQGGDLCTHCVQKKYAKLFEEGQKSQKDAIIADSG
jgi:hypothetical protein